jgi:hypothetical protein
MLEAIKEHPASTRNTGHDGADRDIQHAGDF